MTTESKQPNRAFKTAIIGFLISFFGMIFLLTLNFLLKNSNHVFGKNHEIFTVIKLILYTGAFFASHALPLSVVISAFLYYRQQFRQGETKIKMKRALLSSTLISVSCFIWMAFAHPVIELHQMALHYDMSQKEADSPMKRRDFSLFKELGISFNVVELIELRTQSLNKMREIKADFIAFADTNFTEAQLDTLLKDKSAESLGLTKADFNIPPGKAIKAEYEGRSWAIRLELDRTAANYTTKKNLLDDFSNTIAEMIGFPFLIFVLFYTGMFLGIINRQNKLFLPILVICLTIIPGNYYLSSYFAQLVEEELISGFQSQLYLISIFSLAAIGLFFYARKIIYKNATMAGGSLLPPN